MFNPSRRDLLKGLAGLPLAAAAPPFLSAAQHKKRTPNKGPKQLEHLVVLFHGLFVFVVSKEENLRVFAPRVDDHVYMAGNWSQELQLADGQEYALTADRDNAKKASFDETKHPVLKKTSINLNPKVMNSFSVPYPDEIFGLRWLEKEKAMGDFFDPGPKPGRLPLVTAFVYNNCQVGKQPELSPNIWKAPMDTIEAHLHVRAEPRDQKAGTDGISKLKEAIGLTDQDITLNFKYANCYVCPDLLPGCHDVRTKEECALFEIRDSQMNACAAQHKCTSGPVLVSFSRPVNCAVLVVDTTG